MTEQRTDRGAPPVPIRVIGKASTRLVASVPGAWRLLRTPIRRFFDRAAGNWDERVRPDAPDHMAALAAATDRLDDPPVKALDIGTGTGAAALFLARRFPECEVYGVDISEPMIVAARAKIRKDSKPSVSFSVADASSLPFEDSSFDLVAQLNVPVFFAEIVRVLSPGGHVIVGSSLGTKTPFFTPHRILRKGFKRRGLQVVATGSAGSGTFFVAKRLEPFRPSHQEDDNPKPRIETR